MDAIGKPAIDAVPPKLPAARGALALGVLFAVVGIGLSFFVDLARWTWCPRCPLHELTGLHCPGCGMTRAAHELLHGHILVALHLNALFVLALPVTAVVLAAQAFARRNGRDRTLWLQKPSVVWWMLGVVVAFGIVRNIPVHPFNLLAP